MHLRKARFLRWITHYIGPVKLQSFCYDTRFIDGDLTHMFLRTYLVLISENTSHSSYTDFFGMYASLESPFLAPNYALHMYRSRFNGHAIKTLSVILSDNILQSSHIHRESKTVPP